MPLPDVMQSTGNISPLCLPQLFLCTTFSIHSAYTVCTVYTVCVCVYVYIDMDYCIAVQLFQRWCNWNAGKRCQLWHDRFAIKASFCHCCTSVVISRRNLWTHTYTTKVYWPLLAAFQNYMHNIQASVSTATWELLFLLMEIYFYIEHMSDLKYFITLCMYVNANAQGSEGESSRQPGPVAQAQTALWCPLSIWMCDITLWR